MNRPSRLQLLPALLLLALTSACDFEESLGGDDDDERVQRNGSEVEFPGVKDDSDETLEPSDSETNPGNLLCGSNEQLVDGECQPKPPNNGGSVVRPDGTFDATAFSSKTDLNTAYAVGPYSSGSSGLRTVVTLTDMSWSSAAAWADSQAPMIGSGHALHVVIPGVPTYGQALSFPVLDLSFGNGECGAWAGQPETAGKPEELLRLTPPGTSAALGFYRWDGAKAALVSCPKAGSVRLSRDTSGTFHLSVELLLMNGQTVQRTFRELANALN